MAVKGSHWANGTHVGGKYRSATWTGHIVGVYHQGTSHATTGYIIRPDAGSRHAGEGATIHRMGANIHRV